VVPRWPDEPVRRGTTTRSDWSTHGGPGRGFVRGGLRGPGLEIPDGCANSRRRPGAAATCCRNAQRPTVLASGLATSIVILGRRRESALSSCRALGGHDGPIIAIDIDASRLRNSRRARRQPGTPDRPGLPTARAQLREQLPAGADEPLTVVIGDPSGTRGSAERALRAFASPGGTVAAS